MAGLLSIMQRTRGSKSTQCAIKLSVNRRAAIVRNGVVLDVFTLMDVSYGHFSARYSIIKI